LEIKAKKRFGQNFLKDEIVKKKIVQAIPNDQFKLVEIGAGLGDLTKSLLVSQDVVAYEIDLELCEYLREKFLKEIESGSLELICGDVLDFWESKGILGESYKIVANLPYYIATKIILKALDDKRCESATVMIQREVGEKFLAEVGSREFSSLSVIAQTLSKVSLVVDVPPESFDPPPKVDSVVVQFIKNGESISEGFKNFLSVAFVQPRKTLLKNLSTKYTKELLLNIFDEMTLKHSLRPHQVEAIDYHQIYTTLERSNIGRDRDTEKDTSK
jgi:16S rRNA (adenine1518-N6/adenine1519-N6)-dimethyltransferase